MHRIAVTSQRRMGWCRAMTGANETTPAVSEAVCGRGGAALWKSDERLNQGSGAIGQIADEDGQSRELARQTQDRINGE